MAKQKQLSESTTGDLAPIRPMDIISPDQTAYLANDLAKFIRENKLFHNIQGKEYVNVEGWQYAGSRLGILPQVSELVRVRDNEDPAVKEIKYMCKVVLFDLTREMNVGVGIAICSTLEPSKKYYQEYAIASMAQTRAIGKAYRNILAWIIRAAGYEPTPAEEMDYIASTPVEKESKPIKPAATEPSSSKKQSAEIDVAVQNYVEVPAKDEKAAQPVTILQKTQILLLLNNSTITKEEKEKMVAKLNTFDTVRGDQAIAKLKKTINERSTETGEIAKGELIAEIDSLFNNPVILEEEREQMREAIASGVWLASEAKAALKMMKERIARSNQAA